MSYTLIITNVIETNNFSSPAIELHSTPDQTTSKCTLLDGLSAGQPCHFPFIFKNRHYYACTNNVFNSSVFACSPFLKTVDRFGKTDNKLYFGECNEHCPRLESAKSFSSEEANIIITLAVFCFEENIMVKTG